MRLIIKPRTETRVKNIGVGVPNGNYYSGMVVDPPNLGQSWNDIDLVTLVKNYYDIIAMRGESFKEPLIEIDIELQ